MDFKPIKNNKLYLQVIHQIQQMIYEGKLHKGDKLPPEREISVMLGVSRTAIREAYSALELLGIIESRQGEGTFISSCPPEQKMFEPLSLIFMLEGAAGKELLQLRTLLEVECAKLAANNATADEIAEIENNVKTLNDHMQDQFISVQADRQLHFSIAKASHNVFLYYIFTAISDVIDHHISNMRHTIMQKAENATILSNQHQQIVKYIKNHSADKAGKAMSEHMNFIKSEAFDTL